MIEHEHWLRPGAGLGRGQTMRRSVGRRSCSMKWSIGLWAFFVSALFAVAFAQTAGQAEPQAFGGALPVKQETPDELNQLVAPIALYPDALVAEILAAATYPAEVVEADRWLQDNRGLKADAFAQAIDAQSWDASVKALTQFPSVLAMLDKNLAWTSALGDAYVTASQNVLDAIQAMRQRAQQAGNLPSTPAENVSTQGQTIVIEPADPEVIYVPQYDPWVVYGAPLAFYPGWIGAPGVFIAGPGIAFGLGIDIGVFGGFGWGWHQWGTDWQGHNVMYHHHRYDSHSPTFANHHDFGHGDPLLPRSGGFVHSNSFPQPNDLAPGAAGIHGGESSRSPLSGIRSTAFSGFDHGGIASTFSSRGRASFGGGFDSGGSHAAALNGGGFHGGGGHR
jgi:hypothetical protein